MSRYETLDDETGLVAPSMADLARTTGGGKVCGQCKYFDHSEGQKRMIRERFAEQLVIEHGWKLHHLGSSIEQLGICGAYEAGETTSGTRIQLITGPLHAGCDQYIPAAGLVRR